MKFKKMKKKHKLKIKNKGYFQTLESMNIENCIKISESHARTICKKFKSFSFPEDIVQFMKAYIHCIDYCEMLVQLRNDPWKEAFPREIKLLDTELQVRLKKEANALELLTLDFEGTEDGDRLQEILRYLYISKELLGLYYILGTDMRARFAIYWEVPPTFTIVGFTFTFAYWMSTVERTNKFQPPELVGKWKG
jgi:hypothetical protein